MKETLYPSVEEIFYLHEKLIDRFGGKSGVRDHGLLESALYRPKSGYYKSLPLQAAALLHSFTMNHCFYDGNKRVGLAVCILFLKINGVSISIPKMIFARFIIDEVIGNKIDVESIAKFLEKYILNR